MTTSIFDKIAWIYHPIAKLSRKPKRYYHKIKSVTQTKPTDVILDVGGGNGIIANFFSSDVKHIMILDPSKKMLAKLKCDNITKVLGIAQKIPFKDNTFDLVYCVDSFHHFTNGYDLNEFSKTTDLCIKELLRVLKKDGNLVFIEFDTRKFLGKLISFVENKIMRWGSNFYNKTELKKLFKKYSVNIKVYDLDNLCYIAKITKN